MNVHQNARLTPHSRAELVRRVVVEGQTPTAVAAAFGVTVKTVRKWVARFQTEGVNGLHDRSSRPHHLHRPTPAATVATIEALRRRAGRASKSQLQSASRRPRSAASSGALASTAPRR